jgi:hypothetical protein
MPQTNQTWSSSTKFDNKPPQLTTKTSATNNYDDDNNNATVHSFCICERMHLIIYNLTHGHHRILTDCNNGTTACLLFFFSRNLIVSCFRAKVYSVTKSVTQNWGPRVMEVGAGAYRAVQARLIIVGSLSGVYYGFSFHTSQPCM